MSFSFKIPSPLVENSKVPANRKSRKGRCRVEQPGINCWDPYLPKQEDDKTGKRVFFPQRKSQQQTNNGTILKPLWNVLHVCCTNLTILRFDNTGLQQHSGARLTEGCHTLIMLYPSLVQLSHEMAHQLFKAEYQYPKPLQVCLLWWNLQLILNHLV